MLTREDFYRILTNYVTNLRIKAGTNDYQVDKSTIDKIVASFFEEDDPVKEVASTQIYIARQKGIDEVTITLGCMQDSSPMMAGSSLWSANKQVYGSLVRPNKFFGLHTSVKCCLKMLAIGLNMNGG